MKINTFLIIALASIGLIDLIFGDEPCPCYKITQGSNAVNIDSCVYEEFISPLIYRSCSGNCVDRVLYFSQHCTGGSPGKTECIPDGTMPQPYDEYGYTGCYFDSPGASFQDCVCGDPTGNVVAAGTTSGEINKIKLGGDDC